VSALTNRYTKSASRSVAYHNHLQNIARMATQSLEGQERCALAEKIIIELINKTKDQKDLLENNEKLLKEQKDLLETKDNARKELLSEHRELLDNNENYFMSKKT
jgi:hypothetical protein